MAAYDCIIVGAGHAGGCLALGLRERGYGGSIALIGEEPFPPYERPALSKDILTGAASPESAYLLSPSLYAARRIDLHVGSRVVGVQPRSRRIGLADGREMRYEQLVIATGGRARTLNVAGADLPGVHLLRTLRDALSLREHLRADTRVVVIGGGFIGLEVAAAARQRGAQVTLLESEPSVLARCAAPAIAAAVARLHERQGVVVRTGVQVSEIQGKRSVEAVATRSGEVLEADRVVIGIGIVPNVELAAEAGLELEDGIRVDEYGESSQPGCFSVGDSARFYHPLYGRHVRLECWQHARDHAAAVAAVLSGDRRPYAEVPWLWSDQYAVNLQLAGLTAAGALEVVRGDPQSESFAVFGLRADRLVYVWGFNAGREVSAGRRLIARAGPVDPHVLADPAADLRRLTAR